MCTYVMVRGQLCREFFLPTRCHAWYVSLQLFRHLVVPSHPVLIRDVKDTHTREQTTLLVMALGGVDIHLEKSETRALLLTYTKHSVKMDGRPYIRPES